MIKRYEWEDSLIVAHRDGHITNGALMVCLKLAKAMNWAPKDPSRNEPGLYWKNDLAFKDVGVGRSTYYRHRAELLALGVLEQVRGNLVPRIPESWPEYTTSQMETEESPTETAESTGEQPFTVDTFPVDTCSEETFSVDTAGAGAPAARLEEEGQDSSSLTLEPPSPLTSTANSGVCDLKELRESPVGTNDEDEYLAMMAEWYADHPSEAVDVQNPSAPPAADENEGGPTTRSAFPRPLKGPSGLSQHHAETYWEAAG